jgi:hypothetical protein
MNNNQPGCGGLFMLLLVLPFALILALVLIGPTVGNVFSNIVTTI